jgi:hypothetical protein
MRISAVMEIARQAETLTPDEQLYLIALLAGKVQQAYRSNGQGRQWREIRGAAPYPLVGEDAQAWVSRSRREDDQSREQRWRKAS